MVLYRWNLEVIVDCKEKMIYLACKGKIKVKYLLLLGVVLCNFLFPDRTKSAVWVPLRLGGPWIGCFAHGNIRYERFDHLKSTFIVGWIDVYGRQLASVVFWASYFRVLSRRSHGMLGLPLHVSVIYEERWWCETCSPSSICLIVIRRSFQ